MLNHHGGTGSPDYGRYPISLPIRLIEAPFFSTRSYGQLLLSGVFERFPKLQYINTEAGCAWVPEMLARLDFAWERVRARRGRRVRVREGRRHARAAELLREAQLLVRRELAVAARAARPREDRHRAHPVGQRLPALRGHVSAHAPGAAPRLPRRSTARRCARCSARTRRASTASTSTSSRRSRRSTRRRRTRSRVPLAEHEFPKKVHTAAFRR